VQRVAYPHDEGRAKQSHTEEHGLMRQRDGV
jgi:hypothetical protein